MPRPYDKDFRLSAIQMVQQMGRPIPDAAKNLGISESCLRGWLKQSGDNATAEQLDVQEELKRLRAENARLKVEREILKKAATFFAKEQP